MTLKSKRRILMIVGWVFLVLGVLGLFLPILQGVLFLMVGLILLAKAQPRFRLLKQRIKKRYPKYAAAFDAAEARASDIASGKFFKKKPPR
ncbi:MAG: uncharacterized membrane protein YbaN (DUF454 family) [Alphaproteobacteria bacterium]|jgi:uncharacterized membrane protein YbaN (DUF454 family)